MKKVGPKGSGCCLLIFGSDDTRPGGPVIPTGPRSAHQQHTSPGDKDNCHDNATMKAF